MLSTSTTARKKLEIDMPYLIYKIESDTYTHQETFDTYREARDRVRELRAKQADDADDAIIRLIFAANPEEAVALLSEKRTAPILKEWEK